MNMGIIFDETKLLIKNTTKEERKRKVETALAISSIYGNGNSEYALKSCTFFSNTLKYINVRNIIDTLGDKGIKYGLVKPWTLIGFVAFLYVGQ